MSVDRIVLHASTTDPKDGTIVVDSLPAACPTCGATMLDGYGLCGGGLGPYAMCPTCEDAPFFKVLEADDD